MNRYTVIWQNKELGEKKEVVKTAKKASEFFPEINGVYDTVYDFEVQVDLIVSDDKFEYVGTWSQFDFEDIYKVFK